MSDFPDSVAWEAWLQDEQGERHEAWLRIARRHSGLATTPQARERVLASEVARLTAKR